MRSWKRILGNLRLKELSDVEENIFSLIHQGKPIRPAAGVNPGGITYFYNRHITYMDLSRLLG